MKIQIVVSTKIGEFKSDIREIDSSKIEEFKKISSGYFNSTLELDLEDGSFIIISPGLLKESVFKIIEIE
jgi:hypothetical protein